MVGEHIFVFFLGCVFLGLELIFGGNCFLYMKIICSIDVSEIGGLLENRYSNDIYFLLFQ
jgi:hypothetical protein